MTRANLAKRRIHRPKGPGGAPWTRLVVPSVPPFFAAVRSLLDVESPHAEKEAHEDQAAEH